MSRTGRVLLFRGEPGSLELAGLPVPDPGAGEILVRVEAATLCGSDLHTIHGRRSTPTPTVLGHETLGRVAAFGPGAPRADARGAPLAEGDRVTWAVVAHCGACPRCRRGLPQKCLRATKYGHERADAGREWTGGLAEWCLLVPGTTVVRVPDGLPAGTACPASCATATACAALEAAGTVEGRNVLCTGAGLVGLTAAALAKTAGAARVVVTDPSPARRAGARRFGADEALEPAEVTGRHPPAGDGWDVLVECSGANAAWEMALPGLTVGATAVLVGSVFPAPDTFLNLESVVRRLLTVRGVHNYAPRHLTQAVAFLAGRGAAFPWDTLVGPWFALDDFAAALRQADRGETCRVGFRPEFNPQSLCSSSPPDGPECRSSEGNRS